MNPFEMVAIIVVAVMVASVLRSKYGHRRNGTEVSVEERAEAKRLREEVHQLKDRLKVLERIAVEKENSLAKEIESLRDR